MLTGKTVNLGVIGWPIAHSLSPVLQNEAIAKAGIDYVYTALPVKPEDLAAAVKGLRALQFRGFNVTIPHKSTIMPFLDEIDEDARRIGAVNTVVNHDGHLKGYNTDVTGFIGALLANGFNPKGKNAVILGAGGAAHAVVWGLIKAGVTSLTIGVRNPQKAQSLVERFADVMSIRVFHWGDPAFVPFLQQTDLIVNTTPLGMTPNTNATPPVDWSQVKESAFVYDIIYTPALTRFLVDALRHGHSVLNGEAMLIGQGAAALKRWTGIEPDAEAMTKALHSWLTTTH